MNLNDVQTQPGANTSPKTPLPGRSCCSALTLCTRLGPLCYFQLFIAPSATCWFIGIFWIFPHSVLISHLQHSTAVCFNCLTAVQLFPWALFLPTSHPTPAERTQEHQKLEYSRTAFPSLMILFCHLQKVCLTFSLWFWRWQFLKKTKGNAPAEKSVLIYVM